MILPMRLSQRRNRVLPAITLAKRRRPGARVDGARRNASVSSDAQYHLGRTQARPVNTRPPAQEQVPPLEYA